MSSVYTLKILDMLPKCSKTFSLCQLSYKFFAGSSTVVLFSYKGNFLKKKFVLKSNIALHKIHEVPTYYWSKSRKYEPWVPGAMLNGLHSPLLLILKVQIVVKMQIPDKKHTAKPKDLIQFQI